jgi:DNA polymerase III epsilon subunit-like protein
VTKAQLIVVDLETNGRDVERHQAVEVAWWNLQTGERGEFIPAHSVREVLATAEIRALQINRYIDRIATATQDEGAELVRMWEQFAGPLDADPDFVLPEARIFAAVNPMFDSQFVSKLFANADAELEPHPWPYRMRNLADYFAGVMGRPLDEKPLSLGEICDRLDHVPGDHTAAGDVTATGHCFLALADIAANRLSRPANKKELARG